MSENSEGIGLDALLDSLSNERRRKAILTIASEGMVTKKEMARLIAGEESGEEFDRVRISLHQVHLPKLAERGDRYGNRWPIYVRPERRGGARCAPAAPMRTG